MYNRICDINCEKNQRMVFARCQFEIVNSKLKKSHNRIFILLAISLSGHWGMSQPTLQNPKIEQVASGFEFLEGPVFIPEKGLVFSDIPKNAIYMLTKHGKVTPYLSPSNNSNGLAIHPSGELIATQRSTRSIAVLDSAKHLKTLVSHYLDKRLNAPNDVIVTRDGTIFFTDPPYGTPKGKLELSFSGVFKFQTDGSLSIVDSTLARPNGLALSPNEDKLYVTDTEARDIYVWSLHDSNASQKRKFAHFDRKGFPDGLTTDARGYVYVAGPGGITVFSPAGEEVKVIPIPDQTTNCTWGFDSSLYVTTKHYLYRIFD